MEKKYKYENKESYNPKWLENLKNNNKTPNLVEYQFYEKTKQLSKRKRKSENENWTPWVHVCKHGKYLSECDNCGVLKEYIKKEILIENIYSVSKKRKLRKVKYSSYGKDIVEETKIERIETRITTINEKLNSGYLDTRNCKNLKCVICLKTNVSSEKMVLKNHILSIDETYCNLKIDKTSKRVHFNNTCINCLKEKYNVNYTSGGPYFLKEQIKNIRIHTDKTPEEAKKQFKNLQIIDNDRCYTCNVLLIKKGKSGWAQLSINNINPDQKTNTVLHLSCLACNLCQNNLSYFEFISNILLNSNNCKNTNNSPLNANEFKWVKKGDAKLCSSETRLYVVDKYKRNCKYTGLEIVFESFKFNTASFDRVDSTKPYTKEQTQLVCKHINYVKKGQINESALEKWICHLRTNRIFIFQRYYHHKLLNEWNKMLN